MASLKQGIKQILIQKQHKKYEKEVSDKKLTYDMWIRREEAKLKIDSVIIEKREKNLKNESKNQLNGGIKKGNAGCPSNKIDFFQIYAASDKNAKGRKEMIFFVFPSDISRADFMTIFEKTEADVILFAEKEGEIAHIALPLLYQKFSENESIILIYGDEDIQDKEGRREPWLKPDWSPDAFLSSFYFGSLTAIRSLALQQWVVSAEEADIPGQYKNYLYEDFLYVLCYDMIQKNGGFAKRKGQEAVCHIDEVLFHGSRYPKTAKKVPEAISEGDKTDEDKADAEKENKIQTDSRKTLLVSVIIPSKDNPQVLFKCIYSILNRTESRIPYEIILVDNGSGEENRQWITAEIEKLNQEAGNRKSAFKSCKYLYRPMDFNFSAMCNIGAEKAEGEIFLFFNDDMEVIQGDWLEKMVQKAALPYAGAVGAKLLYPDSDIIQHAGITNLRVGPAHKLQFMSDSISRCYGKNRGVHNVMAVTGACLMIRKEVFAEAGGFDPVLAVAFNDVDLCYSVYEKGYYNIVREDVVFYHHESLSRGKDGESEEKQIRLLKEKDGLYEKHQEIYGKDPFYHKYFTTDMLESEYSPAFHYQVTLDMPWAAVKAEDGILKKAREDKCLVIGMEAAMDIYKWRYGVSPEKGKVKEKPEDMGYYFQGYSFVIGADNACYEKTLLLQNKNTGKTLIIPVDNRYRQDIKNNLKDQLNVDLTGFAAKVRAEELEQGTYRFGMLAEDRCSRQKLVNWSNWVLEVKPVRCQNRSETI